MEGIIIFGLCTWAILDRRVNDGLIGRHFLTFAAIFAAGYVCSGNITSFLVAYVLAIVSLLWLALRQYVELARA